MHIRTQIISVATASHSIIVDPLYHFLNTWSTGFSKSQIIIRAKVKCFCYSSRVPLKQWKQYNYVWVYHKVKVNIIQYTCINIPFCSFSTTVEHVLTATCHRPPLYKDYLKIFLLISLYANPPIYCLLMPRKHGLKITGSTGYA